jgi:hypothetical protein
MECACSEYGGNSWSVVMRRWTECRLIGNDQEARRDAGLQYRKLRRGVRTENVFEYPCGNIAVLSEGNVM